MDDLIVKIAYTGQWSLEKANNFPTHGTGDVYFNTRFGPQKQLLTGPELDRSHEDLKTHYKDNNLPTKTMVNPVSGKEEPHFLMERGMSDGEDHWDPSDKGPNMLDWSTDPNHVITGRHAMMATTDGSIAGDDGLQASYVEGQDKGIHVKFWVPQSHIVGRRNHLAQYLPEGRGRSNDATDDPSHTLVRPGIFPLHSRTTWRRVAPKPGEKYSTMKRVAVHLPKRLKP